MDFLKKEFPNGAKRNATRVNPTYIFKKFGTKEYHWEVLTSGMTSAPGYEFSIVPNFDMTIEALHDYIKTQMAKPNNQY